ncbi:HK97 family phage prohead protease [Mycobacterium hodleri]|uniref:HK97 family phage prohead protease n=1 Tax=Mycolicibacterium hodleri TaxID=49897 RepID=UPI0021F2E135|nr:HK97 family phage prohead protease [Mycolicibacterium hodleri]MCV7134414.1 HK97 family phage prohead protease [Mycolicibacterium hodleri]
MIIPPHKRSELIDVREHRAATSPFELRASATGELKLSGYASTFEPYEMYGGPGAGGWFEQVSTEAFDKTIREKPDVHLLINHEGMPLARTKSETLVLAVDSTGLRVEATLDRSDPDVQRLETKMKRGDMDEMSFAFRVKAQSWHYAIGFDDDPQGLRYLEEVSLHKGDVSIVNFGANPTTSAQILGRRKGKSAGKRRTLSVAEAETMNLIDGKGHPTRTAGGGTRGRTGTRRAEAQRIMAADAAARSKGDAIVARAEELLRACSTERPQVESSPGQGASNAPRGRDFAGAEAFRRSVVGPKTRGPREG